MLLELRDHPYSSLSPGWRGLWHTAGAKLLLCGQVSAQSLLTDVVVAVNIGLSLQTKVQKERSCWLISLFLCVFVTFHREVKNVDQREAEKKKANHMFIYPSVLNEGLKKKSRGSLQREIAFLLRLV